MSRINVLVTFTSRDLKADVIAASVEARPDMNLLDHRAVPVSEVNAILESLPASKQCALVVVSRPVETDDLARQWLARRADLVVMHVDLVDDVVRMELRDPRLDSLLTALAGLVEQVGHRGRQRFARIQLVPSERDEPSRPLLRACMDWLHALLRDAIASESDESGAVHGLTVGATTLLQSLDSPVARIAGVEQNESGRTDVSLDLALAAADADVEPLAAAARTFRLGPTEFRLLLLSLAPELDVRFQRCFGFLLDDMGRRVGTLPLCLKLLGLERGDLADDPLSRWLAFEGGPGRPTAGDEPLRIDPFLARWLLGDRDALANDPLVRRVMRLVPWAGALVMQREEERDAATSMMRRLLGAGESQWIVLGGGSAAEWRALLELGASSCGVVPIRVDATLLAGLDVIAVEECARRIGRMAGLTGDPPVVDVGAHESADGEHDRLRLFLATLGGTGCQAAIVCPDQARAARLLGRMTYELVPGTALSASARAAAVRAAAGEAGAYLSEESARGMARRYPLSVDALEQAMLLARSRTRPQGVDDPSLARFVEASKDVASESLSNLAQRIEPIFELEEVVLPADRQQQLVEVVDNIRLAEQVLDGWKFRDQLPYGRGVTALFFGPSGTGKTMAAIGIARRLGIQLLRIDLSRMVSKYIGDTEKNIDSAFTHAEQSGSAILIDEADALLGKRSEVKDAHDRYANIEVAYLLQRMEAYEGLAILTTNMRQNLDAAFLRRLRFIIDFPRPDATARERIWRQCLPEGSHVLDDAAFRQLARRIDLTGGHIRQITLRAAFAAAAAGTQIGLEHIARAAREEFAKLGMPPVEIDLSQSRRAAA
ncbi:MAG TPA: ATP-binding protein [Gemmatimonadaceae bacterium]|nr:ATP-binding protein [Gemmatimonadaceae bacterium]